MNSEMVKGASASIAEHAAMAGWDAADGDGKDSGKVFNHEPGGASTAERRESPRRA